MEKHNELQREHDLIRTSLDTTILDRTNAEREVDLVGRENLGLKRMLTRAQQRLAATNQALGAFTTANANMRGLIGTLVDHWSYRWFGGEVVKTAVSHTMDYVTKVEEQARLILRDAQNMPSPADVNAPNAPGNIAGLEPRTAVGALIPGVTAAANPNRPANDRPPR